MSTKPSLPATISGVDLSKLTGLSDRRHRQLAALGYFPAARRGRFDFTAAVSGVVRYLREAEARAKTPLRDAQTRRMSAAADREVLALAKDKDLFVERKDVAAMLFRTGTMVKAVLRAALESEYPGKAVGRSAGEIRLLGMRTVDQICEVFSQSEALWPTTGPVLADPKTATLPNEK